MPDTRRNLQARQEGIEGDDVNDGNGWPKPLTDPSNPLKIKVTNGQNGTTKDFRAMSCDGQDQLSLTEGKAVVNTGDQESQGGHGNKLKTSQQNAGEHHTAEGD